MTSQSDNSGAAANKKPREDNLDKDLMEIIEASFKFGNKRFTKLPADKDKTPGEWQAIHQRILTDELMIRLVSYIVRRDHLVKDAGVELGKEIAKGKLEPEEEQ